MSRGNPNAIKGVVQWRRLMILFKAPQENDQPFNLYVILSLRSFSGDDRRVFLSANLMSDEVDLTRFGGQQAADPRTAGRYPGSAVSPESVLPNKGCTGIYEKFEDK